MRTLQEFHDDMMNLDVRKEQAGLNPESTYQLYEDTKELVALMSQNSQSRNVSVVKDSVHVLADRFARMDMNMYPEHMQDLVRSTQLGEGEVFSQNARVYRLRFMNLDSRDTMESHVVNVMRDMVKKHPEYEDVFMKLEEASMQQQFSDEWESQRVDVERQTYQRMMEEDGFDVNTSYTELPAYMTKKLEGVGIFHNPFEEEMHKNEEKSLSSGSGHDTMEQRTCELNAKFGHLWDDSTSDEFDCDDFHSRF